MKKISNDNSMDIETFIKPKIRRLLEESGFTKGQIDHYFSKKQSKKELELELMLLIKTERVQDEIIKKLQDAKKEINKLKIENFINSKKGTDQYFEGTIAEVAKYLESKFPGDAKLNIAWKKIK